MAEIKKYEDVILSVVIEDPTNGRIQNYLLKGVKYIEHSKEFVVVQGETENRHKISLTFNKVQE